MSRAAVVVLALGALALACTQSVRYRLPLPNGSSARETIEAAQAGEQCWDACQATRRTAGDRRACWKKCPGFQVTEGAACKDRPEDREPVAFCSTQKEITRKRVIWGVLGVIGVVLVVVVVSAP